MESINNIKDYNYLRCISYITCKYPEYKNMEKDILKPFWEIHNQDIISRVNDGENELESCLDEFENFLSVN